MKSVTCRFILENINSVRVHHGGQTARGRDATFLWQPTSHVVAPSVSALLQLLLGRVRRQLRLLTRARPISFCLRRIRVYACAAIGARG